MIKHMKTIKKALIAFIGFFTIFTISSCKKTEKFSIYMPDGTPALCAANILADHNDEYDIHIVKASEIAAMTSLPECDMAILPTTVASTLKYKKNVDIKMVSNNVFGNLYIASINGNKNLTDLYNNPLYTTIGTTLDLLKYILNSKQIGYVESADLEENKTSIISKNDASEIIPLLASAKKEGKTAYAVLGEPALSNAMSKISGLEISFDLQALYKDITSYDGYPQACFVAKEDMIKNHIEVVKDVYDLMVLNNEYITTNTANLNEVFKKYDSSLQNTKFNIDIINRSNIRAVKAMNIKDVISNYVKSLTNIDVKDDFFLDF